MITQGSRFTDSTVITTTIHGKSAQVIVPSAQQVQTFSFTSHMWSQGDTIDGLAQAYYSDPTLWWIIADGNPEIMFWGEIAPGTVIRIPARTLQ